MKQKDLSVLVDAATMESLLRTSSMEDPTLLAHAFRQPEPGAQPLVKDGRVIDSPLFRVALLRRLRALLFDGAGACHVAARRWTFGMTMRRVARVEATALCNTTGRGMPATPKPFPQGSVTSEVSYLPLRRAAAGRWISGSHKAPMGGGDAEALAFAVSSGFAQTCPRLHCS